MHPAILQLLLPTPGDTKEDISVHTNIYAKTPRPASGADSVPRACPAYTYIHTYIYISTYSTYIPKYQVLTLPPAHLQAAKASVHTHIYIHIYIHTYIYMLMD